MSFHLDIRGSDALGTFTCTVNRRCLACGKDTSLCLRYRRAHKHLGYHRLELDATILKRCYPDGLTRGQGNGWIGVTCGCYGKLMRQCAHIVDSIAARA